MNLSVVTPEGQKITVDVSEITVPGGLGELGILPGHVPVLTVLDIGVLSYVTDQGEKAAIAINGGFLEVNDDALIILTETAEFASEIDVKRATTARDKITEEIIRLDAGSELLKARTDALRRAENRLALAHKRVS